MSGILASTELGRGGRLEEVAVVLYDGDSLEIGYRPGEHVRQGFQHSPQDVRRPHGDRRHGHVDVTAQQPGALALSVMDPVDAK